MKSFNQEVDERVSANGRNAPLAATAREFTAASALAKYSYNFSWLGRPIIQYPQDIVAMQELVWQVQPDLIIETGTAVSEYVKQHSEFEIDQRVDQKAPDQRGSVRLPEARALGADCTAP